jgi:hypothetical protein
MIKWCKLRFTKSSVSTLYLTTAFTLLLFYVVVVTICSIYIAQAFAHETFSFGNLSITPGWEVEPPLINQLNSIVINITRNEGEGNSVAVRNAFSNLDASIKSGGLTKPLDFEPQEESAGLYRAMILPAQVGSYSILLIGSIASLAINSELRIEDVDDTAKLAFPLLESEGSSGLSALPGDPGLKETSASQPGLSMMQVQSQQLSPLLSDLTRQINSSADTVMRAEKTSEETRNALEHLEVSVGRAYVFGIVSMGIGISGIIIGAFALTRNWDPPGKSRRKQVPHT